MANPALPMASAHAEEVASRTVQAPDAPPTLAASLAVRLARVEVLDVEAAHARTPGDLEFLSRRPALPERRADWGHGPRLALVSQPQESA
jgi:hypothetical protein